VGITHFVKICVKCQLNRASYQKQAGLLQPLLIPLYPWHSISMEFITSAVLVIVEHFNKLANMVPRIPFPHSFAPTSIISANPP
jgi:hypothetical protein